ncbi:signal peptidase I [Candidatus Woesearchaeota archaeon]|nr:MAG: signal peptidase I [Candidatus Woesearchaeota archaeon]
MGKAFRIYLKKFWHFLWYSNSVWSWVANVVIAFVLIKFVIYPGIGLLLHTSYPIVAVVSESMDHRVLYNPNEDSYVLCGTKFSHPEPVDFDKYWEVCGAWYERIAGISKEEFQKYPLRNGFSRGDIIILRGKKPEDIKIGEIIVFKANRPDPIIHRVINKTKHGDEYYFTTKGDHNPRVYPNAEIAEDKISEERVLGVALIRIPWLGYIKIKFVDLLNFMLGKSVV